MMTQTKDDGLTIPPWLMRSHKSFGVMPKTLRAKALASVTAQAPSDDAPLPTLPEGLRFATTPHEEAGFAVDDGVVPKRWAQDISTVAHIAHRLAGNRAAIDADKPRLRALPKKKRPERPADLVSIATIAADLKVIPRIARAMLRAAKVVKPAHGWAFAPADVAGVVNTIKEQLSCISADTTKRKASPQTSKRRTPSTPKSPAPRKSPPAKSKRASKKASPLKRRSRRTTR